MALISERFIRFRVQAQRRESCQELSKFDVLAQAAPNDAAAKKQRERRYKRKLRENPTKQDVLEDSGYKGILEFISKYGV